MADEAVTTTDVDATDATETDAQDTTTTETDDYKGKGSKAAVLADLAAERDARQRISADYDQLKTALASALGVGQDKAELDPESLARSLAEAQAEAAAARLQVAIVRCAPADADVSALLDSNAFTRAMNAVDASDSAAVTKAISDFVTANPRFAVTAPSTTSLFDTARDAASRTRQGSGFSMDDLIRGRS